MKYNRPVLWNPLGTGRLSGHTMQAQLTICLRIYRRQSKPVKPGEWQRDEEVVITLQSYQTMDVFINWTRNYFGGRKSVSLVNKGKEMGQNWVSPLFLFCGTRGRSLAGNRSFFSLFWRVVWQRSFPTEERHPPRPPSSFHFQLFWLLRHFSQFKNQKVEEKKRTYKPSLFLPFLPNSASWVNFAVLVFTVVFSSKFHGS